MSKHLKKYAAPTSWPITRKDTVYITKPSPGSHALKFCLSADLILRQLGFAQTKREIKRILINNEIKVDGRRITEPKFPIGLFDVLSLPNQQYRIVFDNHGRLMPKQIQKEETNKKITKVVGKTQLKGKKLQINLSDGRNIISTEKNYSVGDTLLIETPTNKVIDHLKLDKGALIYLVDGKHLGDQGKVDEITKQNISYTTDTGNKVQTLTSYAYVVGKEKPVITIT